jgi:hypothetical protein
VAATAVAATAAEIDASLELQRLEERGQTRQSCPLFF